MLDECCLEIWYLEHCWSFLHGLEYSHCINDQDMRWMTCYYRGSCIQWFAHGSFNGMHQTSLVSRDTEWPIYSTDWMRNHRHPKFADGLLKFWNYSSGLLPWMIRNLPSSSCSLRSLITLSPMSTFVFCIQLEKFFSFNFCNESQTESLDVSSNLSWMKAWNLFCPFSAKHRISPDDAMFFSGIFISKGFPAQCSSIDSRSFRAFDRVLAAIFPAS